jgi:dihydroorotate dehydrogenase (NAD+) catalytic subunit
MLNAVGLQNIGLEAFLADKLPSLRTIRAPLIVSILSETPDELGEMVTQLDRAEGVAAVELNLSCPNIKRQQSAVSSQQSAKAGVGCLPQMIAQDPEATFAMVETAVRRTRKPVIAKLSPEVTDMAPIAQAAERAGASALALVNTFVGMSLNSSTRRSRLGTMTGGLSGPAIRPLAVYRVWYTAQVVSIPIIGLGGIVRAEDAIEFFLAGASAVAVGTANFANPRASLSVLRGLERYCARHRIASLSDLRAAVGGSAAAS